MYTQAVRELIGEKLAKTRGRGIAVVGDQPVHHIDLTALAPSKRPAKKSAKRRPPSRGGRALDFKSRLGRDALELLSSWHAGDHPDLTNHALRQLAAKFPFKGAAWRDHEAGWHEIGSAWNRGRKPRGRRGVEGKVVGVDIAAVGRAVKASIGRVRDTEREYQAEAANAAIKHGWVAATEPPVRVEQF